MRFFRHAEKTAIQKQPASDCVATIEIKDYGTITVALDASAAPETVANFVSLAKSGFYDGLTFHRIMEGFMMQGGAPKEGSKSPETIKGEFSANGVNNKLSHTRGAISMARANPYDSASSQFFIVHKDSTFLDGKMCCVDYVTFRNNEVVDAVCEAQSRQMITEVFRRISSLSLYR